MFDLIFISADGFPLSAGPAYVGSIFQNHGFSVKLLQSINNFSDEQIGQLVNKFIKSDRQVICVSITFARTAFAKSKLNTFIRLARQIAPNIKVIIGGANNIDENDFDSPSIILLGQNRENEIIDAINKLTGKIRKLPFDFKNHRTNYTKFYDGKAPKGITMVLELSKGCIFNCPFCNYSLRNSKSKLKSREVIKAELEEYYSVFGTSEILLTCNTFNDDPDKVRMMYEISDELTFTPSYFAYTRMDLFVTQPKIVHDFYKKYVKYPFFGIESFNPTTLRAVKKSNNVEKIKAFLKEFRAESQQESFITATFIVGLPHDTLAQQMECVEWLNENDVIDFAFFQPLRILDTETTDHFVNEISEFEKDPNKYGYTILSKEENQKTIGQDQIAEFTELNVDHSELLNWTGWVRTDGYNSTQAIIDGIRLNNKVRCSVPYNFAMLANSRGMDIQLKIRDAFRPTSLLKLKDQSKQHYSTEQILLTNEMIKFNDEYFNFIMNND